MTLVKTDLGFLRIVQKFKIVGRETNNNKVSYALFRNLRLLVGRQYFVIVGLPTNNPRPEISLVVVSFFAESPFSGLCASTNCAVKPK